MALKYGQVTTFRAYLELPEISTTKWNNVRSELQNSGVSLIDCPHNGRKDVADKMMIVDMLTFALDTPSPASIILVSGDRDFAYAVSTLRSRAYSVYLVTPTTSHAGLKAQATQVHRWTDVIRDSSKPASLPPKPNTSSYTTSKAERSAEQYHHQGVYVGQRPEDSSVPLSESDAFFAPPPYHSLPNTRATKTPNLRLPATLFSQEEFRSASPTVPYKRRRVSSPERSEAESFKTNWQFASRPNKYPDDTQSHPSFEDPRPAVRHSTLEVEERIPSRHNVQRWGRQTTRLADETSTSNVLSVELTQSVSGLLERMGSPIPSASQIDPVGEFYPTTVSRGSGSGTHVSVPDHLLPLLEVLEGLYNDGDTTPLRSIIGISLKSKYPSVCHHAGVGNFKEYVALAESAGLVAFAGIFTGKTISLRVKWSEAERSWLRL
jgi:hypothetical protein